MAKAPNNAAASRVRKKVKKNVAEVKIGMDQTLALR